jgi:2-octaprenylphenol hydroxylase
LSRSRALVFDVIIVGAGVTGAVMASLLARRKLTARGRVAIVADRFAQLPPADADWDLRVFALSRASERLLTLCGVWQNLPANRVTAYDRMCVWDAGGAPESGLSFEAAQIGEPNLGSIVEGRALQWECLQASRSAGTVLIEGEVKSAAADDEAVMLHLSDGRELRAKLLAVADGTDSKTRALLGIDAAGHAYDQDALVAHVETAKPHGNTAWQRFLTTGPLAFLPLADGRSSIVWSVTQPRAAELRAMDAAAFGAALTDASGAALGECRLTTGVAAFPLKLDYALRYAAPRAVLLGDAAHAVHPLAGQGLNLALLDCAALAEVLGEAGGAEAFGDPRYLRRYERWRRSENMLAAAALDGLERLFSRPGARSSSVRTSALGAVGRLAVLKRAFARRALGLSGDLPQFLQGAAREGT